MWTATAGDSPAQHLFSSEASLAGTLPFCFPFFCCCCRSCLCYLMSEQPSASPAALPLPRVPALTAFSQCSVLLLPSMPDQRL